MLFVLEPTGIRMKSDLLSSTGLLLATAASLANVGFDVAAKRALRGNNFLRTTLKIRTLVAVLLSLVLAGLWFYKPTRSSVALFREGPLGLLHGAVLPVLLLSTVLVTVSILLYYRSLQIAPLSVVAPLFGLTPIFLLITGFVVFRQVPSVRVTAGVLCILLGSLQAHWKPSMRSPRAAVGFFLREKGVRTMLGACLLLSITNLLDQWLVRRMDVLSYAWLYVVLCAVFTGVLVLVVRPGKSIVRPAQRWFVLASVVDASMLLLQFASLQYVDAVVTIAIKRSGMLLSVIAGSLLFGEKHGRQRLAAAFVVLMGVLVMYFNLKLWALCAVLSVAAVSSVVAILSAKPAEALHEPEFQATTLC